jgi:2-dehydropantoate 2-reductase
MSLQNGLGHEDILAEVAGASHILAGKTYVGGVLLGPGHIIAGTRGKRTIIGELDGSISKRVTAIAEEFERAELPTTVSDNIVGTIWDKLLINVSTGALSALTGLPYGSLYAVPEIEACAIAAVAEAMAVAQAAGVKLSIESPRDASQQPPVVGRRRGRAAYHRRLYEPEERTHLFDHRQARRNLA